MDTEMTYRKLGAYHKARYRFYKFLNTFGLTSFPSEYWETSPEGKKKMEKEGYRLTKRGWVKR